MIVEKGVKYIVESLDSVKLLKECDAGAKMAVSSFEDVLENVCDSNMKELLQDSKVEHEKLGDEIHKLLNMCGAQEKDPNPMAVGMSWIKTNMKLAIDNCDATVADLIIDGCNMGVKSLYKYLNQYENADQESKRLCKMLINIEEKLCDELKKYL